MKLPILNDHKCKGIYDGNFKLCPNHFCWISHIILGLLSIKFEIIEPLFIIYQISQMIMKRKYWDDLIDIIEFYIGKKIFKTLL